MKIIWYNPELFVWHLIRNEKISIGYRFKEALIRGESIAKFSKKRSSKVINYSPIMLLKYIFIASWSAFKKLIQSLQSKDHYFSILHKDYEDGTWRNIGIEWYRVKLLVKRIFGST